MLQQSQGIGMIPPLENFNPTWPRVGLEGAAGLERFARAIPYWVIA
jgi:hypothetical protein